MNIDLNWVGPCNKYDKWVNNWLSSYDKTNASDITTTNVYKCAIVDLKKPEIKQIIFNVPATIVYWKDGSKTVVKCTEGDTFDPGVGIMMATIKKIFGDDYHKYKNSIKKAYGNAIWQMQKKGGAE